MCDINEKNIEKYINSNIEILNFYKTTNIKILNIIKIDDDFITLKIQRDFCKNWSYGETILIELNKKYFINWLRINKLKRISWK
jgi:hypothetical protein